MEEYSDPSSNSPESSADDEFDRHRGRLKRMIDVRLHPRLRGRVDPSDIIQDTLIEAHRRKEEYSAERMPYYLWLRMIATRNLIDAHREHLGTQKRDAAREFSMNRRYGPKANSVSLAAQLMGTLTTASRAAMRLELRERLDETLNQMDDLDREVLSLRHFEQLTNAEIAQVLEISPNAASNRYIRALHRLRSIIKSTPGFDESQHPS